MDSVTALALAMAVPVGVTVAVFVARRRVDPIGAVAVVAFGIALLVLALSGGNDLVLKLQEAVITGPVGVACLVSVAIGKPLHLLLFKMLDRRRPGRAVPVPASERRRVANVVTSLLGTTLVVHALVLLVLALSLPTGTYLAIARPLGLAIVAAGAAVVMWYRRRVATPDPAAR
jgi:hypothetical protein